MESGESWVGQKKHRLVRSLFYLSLSFFPMGLKQIPLFALTALTFWPDLKKLKHPAKYVNP